jgi:D-threo-aldose 1-dehydrogenase
MELDFLRTGLFDVVLSHNRYTLVDSSAAPLIRECAERGVAFINAAPFGGGMLVRGPEQVPTYCYAPVAEGVLDRVKTIERTCQLYGVPMAAVALQFSARDPRVSSTVVGMSRPERFAQMLDLLQTHVPDELWAEVEPLAFAGRDGVLT